MKNYKFDLYELYKYEIKFLSRCSSKHKKV